MQVSPENIELTMQWFSRLFSSGDHYRYPTNEEIEELAAIFAPPVPKTDEAVRGLAHEWFSTVRANYGSSDRKALDETIDFLFRTFQAKHIEQVKALLGPMEDHELPAFWRKDGPWRDLVNAMLRKRLDRFLAPPKPDPAVRKLMEKYPLCDEDTAIELVAWIRSGGLGADKESAL